MNHDIAHCANPSCPSNGTCQRYKAHLEFDKGDYPGPVSYGPYVYDEEKGCCNSYLEDK